MKYSIFLFLLLTFSLSAQNDVLFMKDGSALRGEILEQGPSLVKIRIAGGTETEVKTSVIKRIKEDKGDYVFHEDGTSNKQKGLYKSLQLHAMVGKASSNEEDQTAIFGLGGQLAVGWQFNPYFSVGAGAGLHLYDIVFGDAFVQLRGFLPKGKVSPTIAADIGYGVPLVLSQQDNPFVVTKGGMSLRPSVGLRIATRNRSDILLDAGYQFQNAFVRNDWGWGWREEYRIWYRRLNFRIGWNF